MTASAVTPRLTLTQQAAVARVAYAVERPSALALLCGPAGVGKSRVLSSLAAAPALASRTIAMRTIHEVGNAWQARGAASVPDVLIVDDAHLATDGQLPGLVQSFLRNQARGSVVLCGEGRLLSLVARDTRLEQAVVLRASLPPFTLDESRMLVAAAAAGIGSPAERDEIACTIHEIAAGIPALVVRLAELVDVLVQSSPGRAVSADDVEALHRRLCLQAA